jgi:hypothetical protein
MNDFKQFFNKILHKKHQQKLPNFQQKTSTNNFPNFQRNPLDKSWKTLANKSATDATPLAKMWTRALRVPSKQAKALVSQKKKIFKLK